MPDWWFAGPIPLARRGERLDRQLLDDWVAAQPSEIRFLFEFVRDRIDVVSHARFRRELEKSFRLFLDRNPRRKKLLFLVQSAPRHVRSPVWATALVRSLFPEETRDAEYAVIAMRAESAFSDEDKKKITSGDYELVLVDDAAYGGSYVTGLLDGWLSTALPGFTPPQVHVICAYTSTRAREKFAEFPYIAFYATGQMPSVAELVAKMPRRERERFAPYLEINGIVPGNKVLTLFDHKAPDSWSFVYCAYDGIVHGICPNGSVTEGGGPPILFITQGREPYRGR